MWSLKIIEMNIFAETFTDKENKFIITNGEREGWRDWIGRQGQRAQRGDRESGVRGTERG